MSFLFPKSWPVRLLLGVPLLLLIAPLVVPQVLAFAHHQRVAGHELYSEVPINASMLAAVAAADAKVATGPLGEARAPDQPIFVTKGGWRWMWLAGRAQGALAVSRGLGDYMVLNNTDPQAAEIRTGGELGLRRPLDEVIAHEMTHGSIRAHFGWQSDFTFPQMLLEGFCEYVAGGSTLDDTEAEALLDTGTFHPALPYWQGRKAIEQKMAQPGMDADRLFAEWE